MKAVPEVRATLPPTEPLRESGIQPITRIRSTLPTVPPRPEPRPTLNLRPAIPPPAPLAVARRLSRPRPTMRTMPEARRVEVVELPEAELHEIVPPPLPWRRSSVLPTSEILASPLSAVSALDDGELEYLFRPSVFHRATSFVRAVWFFGATFAIETVRWLGTSAPKQWARATARAYSPVVRST